MSEQENTSVQSDDEKLARDIHKKLKDSKTHFSDWREETKKCYDFYAGHQWLEEDKQVLLEQNRPAVVFNRVARTINAITGLEINNRQEVQYLPREVNDSGVNEILTDASKWVRDGCDAEDEESDAFKDTLICGVGWTETKIEYDRNTEGQIIINRIDPLRMLVDPATKKANFDDARWIAYVKQLTKEEIIENYKDQDLEYSDLFGDEDIQPHDATNDDYTNDDKINQKESVKYYDVVQFQYFEKRAIQISQNPSTGEKIELNPKQAIMWKAYFSDVEIVKIKKRFYKQVILIGKKIIDKIDLTCNDFTFKAITGLRDRNNNIWFGVVRLMIDPQMWANKWLSQIQHIINSNAKGGLLVEKGVFPNINKAQNDWAKADSIIEVNAGALSAGRILPKEAPRYPDGIDRLLQYAVGSINDVTGVNVELLGLANRDQSGVLEQERKESGTNILASFFDSLRRYRKEQGRVLAHYITEYISDGRLIRIIGDEGAQYIPLLKDKLTFDYDVVIDDTPVSHNQKLKVFDTLIQLIPVLQQSGIPIPPEILDYAPLPTSLTQKWKKQINQPNPVAQQMQQIQVQGADLENKKTESEVVLNYAKAQNEGQNAQDQSQIAKEKAAIDIGSKQAKMLMDASLSNQKMQHEEKKFALQQGQKNIAFGLDQRRKQIASTASSSNKQ